MNLEKEKTNNNEVTNEKIENIVEEKIENNNDIKTEASIETINLSKQDSVSFMNLDKEKDIEQSKENISLNKTTYQKIENSIEKIDNKFSEFSDKLSESATNITDKVSKSLEKTNNAIHNMDENIANKTEKLFNKEDENSNNTENTNTDKSINNTENKSSKIEQNTLLIALILNIFLPGVGQIIIGQTNKGIAIIIGSILSLLIVSIITCGTLTIPFQIALSVGMCLDLYNCANIINQGGQLGDMQFIIFK